MKRNAVLLLAALMSATSLMAAESTNFSATPAPGKSATEERKPGLLKFDLDFPGGTPGQLVSAISKASGHPLNAIIPQEDEAVMLPPLRMRSVDVVQLFNALELASHKTVLVGGPQNYSYNDVRFGFRHYVPQSMQQNYEPHSMQQSGGEKADQDTVWVYYDTRNEPQFQQPPVKTSRFYQLNPYLKEHSVESITTAIETGWKMLGETNPPTLSFHKDTGLLIAVGTPERLKVIDQVLENLERPKEQRVPPPRPPPAPGVHKPDAE